MANWNDVAVFLQIVRAGTVTEAARVLRLDHSTVSRRLAALETELEVRLFDRAGRRLALTQAGHRLAAAAARMESVYLSETAGLAPDGDKLAGCVRIGAPEGLGVGFMTGFLAAMGSAYPDLELELVALPRDYSLARREADIAITLDRPSSGDVSTRKLADYSLLLYGVEAYFATHGLPADSDDLGSHLLCGYIPDLLHTNELDYAGTSGKGTIRLRSTSIVAQLELVRSGAAIGILPHFLARQHRELVPILPREIALLRSYWVSIHDDLKRAPRQRGVLQALLAYVRSRRPWFSYEYETRP